MCGLLALHLDVQNAAGVLGGQRPDLFAAGFDDTVQALQLTAAGTTDSSNKMSDDETTDTTDEHADRRVVDEKSSRESEETDDTALKAGDDKPVTVETTAPSVPDADAVPEVTTPDVAATNDHPTDDPANSVDQQPNSPAAATQPSVSVALDSFAGHVGDHGGAANHDADGARPRIRRDDQQRGAGDGNHVSTGDAHLVAVGVLDGGHRDGGLRAGGETA